MIDYRWGVYVWMDGWMDGKLWVYVWNASGTSSQSRHERFVEAKKLKIIGGGQRGLI